jgi:sugar-specific transcriptional regulator TrmB
MVSLCKLLLARCWTQQFHKRTEIVYCIKTYCILHSDTIWQIVVYLTACICEYTHNYIHCIRGDPIYINLMNTKFIRIKFEVSISTTQNTICLNYKRQLDDAFDRDYHYLIITRIIYINSIDIVYTFFKISYHDRSSKKLFNWQTDKQTLMVKESTDIL